MRGCQLSLSRARVPPWTFPQAHLRHSNASGSQIGALFRQVRSLIASRSTDSILDTTTYTGKSLLRSGPLFTQVRHAGRVLGLKRKKKNERPRTVHQTGLGKRMEFFWPKKAHRTRVPLYENSRRNLIWDHRMRRWMVMWYRDGIQVFRNFHAKEGSQFEQARSRAILFLKQLQQAGKLGRPKPDIGRSGVRGVYFDPLERSWVARWSDCGMKKYAVYSTVDMGFKDAYQAAVHTRISSIRRNHMFVMQRTRWAGHRKPLGTFRT